ncbi:cytochrome c oxidase subunit 7A-related protein, mitochondrial-like [Ornithodoros turicata]|uniref:Putative cytochrome c oxidase subunit viia n=1 Tax=Ornithodoros turicata TaxID=34597 RepID=A0A2R5LE22_9ACAR
MNSARALVKTSKHVSQHARTFTSLERIKELQRLFSKDDGVPVHLKRGVSDRVLFQGTMGLCVISLGFCFNSLFHFMFPKKKAN